MKGASNGLRLNLGCGTDIRPGFLNVDSIALPGVDLVRDITDTPLPFDDQAVEEVICKDVLEHIDYIPVLADLNRILCQGGRLHIRVPHFTSRALWLDPTHIHGFSVDTFRFFVRGDRFSERNYYFSFAFTRLANPYIHFHRYRYEPWNFLLPYIVNRGRRAQEYYEATVLARIFPATDVTGTLIK